MAQEGTGEIANYWTTNLIVSKDQLPELEQRKCMVCGSTFFHQNRNILVVWMGEAFPARLIPAGMGWIQHKCRGCKMLYNIYYQ